MSARIAETRWARSPATRRTREPMLGVIAQAPQARPTSIDADAACRTSSATPRSGRRGTRRSRSASEHGFRNSQVTVLAPTGTIGFMMDCDTTGIEPDIALIKYKKLVGGGMLKIVNNTVPAGAGASWATHEPRSQRHHRATSTSTRPSRARPHLKAEHLPVFDCAFKPAKGKRSHPLAWATCG